MVPVVAVGAAAADSEAPAVTLATPVSPGVACSRNTTSASRTLYGIVVWLVLVSLALQMIGASTGIPVSVLGVPSPQPVAGIPTPF